MKKIYSILLAALAVCAVSCQEGPLDKPEPDTPETPETGETMTFTASLTPGTKVALGETNEKGETPAYWEKGDKITIFDVKENEKNGPVYSEPASFGEDNTKASFVVHNAPSAPEYAIYGTLGSEANYWKGQGQAGKVHNVLILQTQIAKSSNNISAAPLIAKVNGTELQFKNIAALLKVNVAVEGVKEISLVANTEAKISGEGAAYINGDGNPVFEPYEGAHNNVILTAGSDKTLSGVYYIAIAPANVTSLTLYVNGNPYRSTDKVKQFKSGEIFNLGDITDNCNGKYYLLGDDNQWSIAKAPVFVEEGEYLVARNVKMSKDSQFKIFKNGKYFSGPFNLGQWSSLAENYIDNMIFNGKEGNYDVYINRRHHKIKIVSAGAEQPIIVAVYFVSPNCNNRNFTGMNVWYDKKAYTNKTYEIIVKEGTTYYEWLFEDYNKSYLTKDYQIQVDFFDPEIVNAPNATQKSSPYQLAELMCFKNISGKENWGVTQEIVMIDLPQTLKFENLSAEEKF